MDSLSYDSPILINITDRQDEAFIFHILPDDTHTVRPPIPALAPNRDYAGKYRHFRQYRIRYSSPFSGRKLTLVPTRPKR